MTANSYTDFAEKLLIALYQESEDSGTYERFKDVLLKYGLPTNVKWLERLSDEWNSNGYVEVNSFLGSPLEWGAEISGPGMRYVEEKYGSKDGVGQILQPVNETDAHKLIAPNVSTRTPESTSPTLSVFQSVEPTASTNPTFSQSRGVIDYALPAGPTAQIIIPSEAPASDRIVLLTDNQPAVIRAREALVGLATHLDTANDIGGFTSAEIDEAKREVWLLEQALLKDSVRVDWIEPLAKSCLKWIAVKAAEQLVGQLAIAALTAIAVLIGFSI